jgi:hypothetical protein
VRASARLPPQHRHPPQQRRIADAPHETGTVVGPIPHTRLEGKGRTKSRRVRTDRVVRTAVGRLGLDTDTRMCAARTGESHVCWPHPHARHRKGNIHAASTRITPEWCFRPHPAFGIPDGTCRLTRHRQARSQGPPHTAHHTPRSTPPSEPFPQLLPTTH